MKRTALLFLMVSLFLCAEKLEITADKFIAKDADKKVSFIGHARIAQGPTVVKAPRIILYFNEDNSTKMYKASEGVHFHIQKNRADYEGSCSVMEYLPKEKKYILTGDVKVKDRSNQRDITANRIEIHSKTGAFSIEGSQKRAAKLVFEMK